MWIRDTLIIDMHKTIWHNEHSLCLRCLHWDVYSCIPILWHDKKYSCQEHHMSCRAIILSPRLLSLISKESLHNVRQRLLAWLTVNCYETCSISNHVKLRSYNKIYNIQQNNERWCDRHKVSLLFCIGRSCYCIWTLIVLFRWCCFV